MSSSFNDRDPVQRIKSPIESGRQPMRLPSGRRNAYVPYPDESPSQRFTHAAAARDDRPPPPPPAFEDRIARLETTVDAINLKLQILESGLFTDILRMKHDIDHMKQQLASAPGDTSRN